jgi:hypothetical protein
MNDVPSFSEAQILLRKFLLEQQKPSEIDWIFREDLVRFRRFFGIKTPLPGLNERFVERLFDLARTRGNGVELSVFCFCSRRAFIYVYVPENAEDAKDRMMFQQLKLTIRETKGGVHRCYSVTGLYLAARPKSMQSA